MTPLAAAIETLVLERARFERALKQIANINNGPDLASASYRCQEAARIAERALKGDVADRSATP
jgi:hypothetical protein